MLRLVLLAAWLVPVDGDVVRAFTPAADPFAAGLHRGIDVRARPGEAVRAPCTGRVAFAGGTPRGPAVTLRCGALRATVLPVRAVVRRGEVVPRGRRLGEVAGGELHLSARDAAGYLDPQGLLARPRPPAGPAAPLAPLAPAARRHPEPPRAAPHRAPFPSAPPAADRPGVPWTLWAGAMLLVAGMLRGVRPRARRQPRRGAGAVVAEAGR